MTKKVSKKVAPPTAGGENQCNHCTWHIGGKCVASKGAYCKTLRDRF